MSSEQRKRTKRAGVDYGNSVFSPLPSVASAVSASNTRKDTKKTKSVKTGEKRKFEKSHVDDDDVTWVGGGGGSGDGSGRGGGARSLGS